MLRLLTLILAVLIPLHSNIAKVHLPKFFGNHMVVQRGQPITIWGWADPYEQIKVEFKDQTEKVEADDEGNWRVTFGPEPAGGPYQLTVSGNNKLRFENILVGDVWVCSGQSNMQWMIDQTGFIENDSNFIAKNYLRLFSVQIDTDYFPRQDLKGGEWKVLSQENINQFSAVAYHFGKNLMDSLKIPIGLINSSLGATSIETWMSNESLLRFEQFKAELEPIVASGKTFSQIRLEFEKNRKEWEAKYYLKGPGIDGQWHRPDTDVSDWQNYTGPGAWEERGLPNHDGAVWFRANFDLPSSYDQDSFFVSLSQIDDYDITWINGNKVGETFGRHNHRNYTFPTSMAKPKDNVIVIRAFDLGGQGGFTTNPFWTSELVRGPWKMKAGKSINPDDFPTLPTVNVSPFSSPAVLYNANIAPLTSLEIAGFIWYQGESNVIRAVEYRQLFPALIRDWRSQWKDPNLPFLFVQLANHHPEAEEPGESQWAELREAQDQALSLPNVGRAVTIDIGEADDIHPRNKQDVGFRLALAALRIAYSKAVIHSGPIFQSVEFVSGQAVVQFEQVGSGLMTKNKHGYVHGFAIAGADKQFYWASAEIRDEKVWVYIDKVSEPVAVRYAWSDNPGALDLFNKEGLPAAPFRSDRWQLSTAGSTYDHTKARF